MTVTADAISPRRPASVARQAHSSGERDRRALDIVAFSLGVIAVLALLAALREGRVIAIPTVMAALLAVALTPVAALLERRGAPRGLAAGALVFGSVGALGAILYALAPSAEALSYELPGVARRLEAVLRRLEADVASIAPGGVAPSRVGAGDNGLLASGKRLISDSALAAPAMLGGLVYGVVLAFFLLAERARIGRAVLGLAQGQQARLALLRAMRDVRLQVSTYLLTITLINIGFGMVAGLVLWALGTPNAAVWGAAVALLNFMPFIGIALVNLALFASGVVNHGGIEAALVPVLALIVLNMIEGNAITPRLVGRRVEVSALAVFFAIAFGAWLWGPAGAVIATPALIFLRAFGLRLIEARRASRC